ncbi:MAG: LrgB family protein [Treponema sp.]|nr:LrgB family protein [Treponema sp.]
MNSLLHTLYSACIDTPFFGIALSIVAYKIGVIVREKSKLILLNPLLVATIIVILLLKATGIPYPAYKKGGDILMSFLAPVTAVLAIAMYNQRKILMENLIPVIAGTFAGSVASVATVFVLGKLFHLDMQVVNSMLPKSVTTPIALSLSRDFGGILPITMISVICSGFTGGIFAPSLIRIFHVKHPEAAGIAIGSCSHAIGTATALEIGEVYGAMSSVAIGCMGLATTLVFMVLDKILL